MSHETSRRASPPPELRLLLTQEKTNVRTVFGGAGLAHAALLLFLLFVAWARPDRQAAQLMDDFDIHELVFLDSPGPAGGGGGGGTESPEPPSQEPTPAVKPPEPEPIPVPDPTPPAEPVEPERLAEAPVVPTDVALAALASASSISPTLGLGQGPGAGTGKDGGIGSGEDGGLGKGRGPGCCDGDSGPGAVDVQPHLVYRATPQYTQDGVLHRVQGESHVTCIVTRTGTVGDCSIAKPLDNDAYGLDTEAVRTARQFRFRPATLQGKPVPALVTIIIQFNIR